jgi:hypothetical protein
MSFNFNNFWFPLFALATIILIIFFQNPIPDKNIFEKNKFNLKAFEDDLDKTLKYGRKEFTQLYKSLIEEKTNFITKQKR